MSPRRCKKPNMIQPGATVIDVAPDAVTIQLVGSTAKIAAESEAATADACDGVLLEAD